MSEKKKYIPVLRGKRVEIATDMAGSYFISPILFALRLMQTER